MRTKSSLSPQRVKKAPEFKKTRMHAEWLAQASKISSQVYRSQLYKDQYIFQRLTGEVMRLLKQGLNETDIIRSLGYRTVNHD